MGLQSSSMEQLADIKPTFAKFDQRRLHHSNDSSTDPTVQQRLNNLCSQQGIEIIAKSVESAEQIAELTGKGITLLQGYLFDHPKEAEKFIERWGEKPEAANDATNLRKAG